jgi:hypothetical protein
MKITKASTDILCIQPLREAMLLIIPGALFALMGFIAFPIFGQSAALTCERSEGSEGSGSASPRCELERTLIGIPLSTTSIQGLQGARVGTPQAAQGHICRVMLVTAESEVPFSGYSISGGEEQRIAEQINAFPDKPNHATLHVRYSGRTETILSAVLAVLGLLVLVTGLHTCSTTWTFDRRKGLFTHRQQRLLGPRVVTYPFSQIEDVTVSAFSATSAGHVHRIVLRTSSGKELPMTSRYYLWRDHLIGTVRTIRRFLDL